MAKGSDVAAGDPVVRKGQVLTPGRLGLLAAAGHSRIRVAPRPKVGILATGDEVTAPGMPLGRGKLYASNMVTLSAWCRRAGMQTLTTIVRDDAEALADALQTLAARSDAVITSGGAWTGDRDLVASVLREMGWRQIFHRVRMGPGKAVGFGLLAEKPVFILPGGPPSNVIGFLQIAWPGLMQQSGRGQAALPVMRVRAGQELSGRNRDWTHFVFGRLEPQAPLPLFFPVGRSSRLQALAEATALAAVPEGRSRIEAGTEITVQLLTESHTCLAAEE
jgi:molybdopterin molybdotransferase